MFGRHHRGVYGRGPFGFHGHREPHEHGHHERGGRGGRMGRFFDHGDLRLVVLKLIADKPSHGYELIKAIETAAGGAYAPSPGVIYPTLTLLEDMGFAAQTDSTGSKKAYAATPEGLDYLAANHAAVQAIFSRMQTSAAGSQAFSPQILRARENLKTALRLKLMAGALTPEQVAAIAQAMDAAAVAIERA
jgi:DNA-binding PadR family transcriptional regulator